MTDNLALAYHHFVVIPSKRPRALRRLLKAYKIHLKKTGFPAKRVHFIVVNNGVRETYRELKSVTQAFKDNNPKLNIHFVDFQWRNEFLRQLKEAGVHRSLRRYFSSAYFSQLRNLGYYASRSLAHQLNLDSDRVILHQVDDDVLPKYILGKKQTDSDGQTHENFSEKPCHFPKSCSVFATAEKVYANSNVVALLGRYSGIQDEEVVDAITRAMMAGRSLLDKDPPGVREGIDANPSRALRYARGLAAGVHNIQPVTWEEKPKEEQFTTVGPFSTIHKSGGAISVRLSRFGFVPPTPYRGEDTFQVNHLLQRYKNGIFFAPGRMVFHDKHIGEHRESRFVLERDPVSDAESDFNHVLLGRMLDEPDKTIDRKLIIQVIKKIADLQLKKLLPEGYRKDHLTEYVTAVRASLEETRKKLEALEYQIQRSGTTSHRKLLRKANGARVKIEKLKETRRLQTIFQHRLDQLVKFYEKMRTEPPGDFMDKFEEELKEYRIRLNLLQTYERQLVSSAQRVPIRTIRQKNQDTARPSNKTTK